jgi:hypothetical protein
MSKYSAETYRQIFDQLLSQELGYTSSCATESNIKNAMKRVLGISIKSGVIKGYAFLVLDEDLNVHFTIIDPDGTEFPIVLYYGQ